MKHRRESKSSKANTSELSGDLRRLAEDGERRDLSSSWPTYFVEDMEEGLELPKSDLAILVMGVTGAGKSTFISGLTHESVGIGHSLESFTTEVHAYQFRRRSNGQRIYLIDTPGFDDTQRSNVELLQKIAYLLCNMYRNRCMTLCGLIYLHRITDQRMGGSSLKSLRIFEKLCGEDNFENVALVTTMWGLLQSGEARSTGEKREETLKVTDEFFGKMVDKGASMTRHEGDHGTAYDIVEALASRERRVVTSIQREMVDEHKILMETSAGRFLQDDLHTMRRRLESERDELQEALEDARREQDEDLESTISDQKRECEKRIKQSDIDQGNLSVTLEELTKDQPAWIANMMEEARRREKEMEDMSQHILQLEEQLNRTEREHIRELNLMRREQKGQSSQYEHALERYEEEKRRLREQLRQQKAASQAKEKDLRRYKHQEGFFMKIYKAFAPQDRDFVPYPRRTKTLPLALGLQTPHRGSNQTRPKNQRSRTNRERSRSQFESARPAELEYSSSGSEETFGHQQGAPRIVTAPPSRLSQGLGVQMVPSVPGVQMVPSVPGVQMVPNAHMYDGGYSVLLATPTIGPPRNINPPDANYQNRQPPYH